MAGNYFLGEDIYNGSNAQRDMGNPTVYHYNLLSIGTPNLHTNGGIQNKAFWLLAQNSTNTNASPYNQIAVTGIGRTKAEKISIVPLQVVT